MTARVLPKPNHSYDHAFYDQMSEVALFAAKRVVPVILSAFRPTSIVDVGCGTGVWARAFLDAGISDVVGVDGDWVDDRQLCLPAEQFRRVDLTRPFTLPRRFDMCLCLETAEHLPEERAAGFAADLTRLSDVVVFSAAIPFQGGVDHCNERWQSYWVELFAAQGYVGVDYVRRRIWTLDRHNAWFYAQNMIIFVKEDALEHYPLLAAEYRHQAGPPISLVHPGLLVLLQPWERHLSVRGYFRMLPRMLWRAVAALTRTLAGRAPSRFVHPAAVRTWHPGID